MNRQGLKTKMKALKRVIAILMTPLLIATCTPLRAYAEECCQPEAVKPPAESSPAKKQKKGPRKVTKFTPSATLNDNPSDLEISTARIFEEPLVPMSNGAVENENRSLSTALNEFVTRQNREDLSSIKSFIDRFPGSRWRAALELNLALHLWDQGFLTEALQRFASAFELSKNESGVPQQAVAQRAISELVVQEARLGRMEELERDLARIGNRKMLGSNEARVQHARDGLKCMKDMPDIAFKCGPFAVNSLLMRGKNQKGRHPAVDNFASTRKGTNMQQVKDLANQVGMKLQPARREAGVPLVVPSIMHLTLGHFAAITNREADRFQVKDPTFGSSAHMWLSQQALDTESDGLFLIPGNSLPKGYVAISRAEAESVWGRGGAQSYGGNQMSPDAESGPPEPGCGSDDGCCNTGMAQAKCWLMTASLNIFDTPLSYAPPIGPSMDFRVNYNDAEENQPATFTFSNFGPNWKLKWISYMTVDGSGNATVRLGDGGSEIFTNHGGGDPYSPDILSQADLVNIGTNHYERRLPDGSIAIYDQPDSSSPVKIFMTEFKDPRGNSVTIQYDSDFRVTTITDAIGQVSTLSYVSNTLGNSGFYKIDEIEDPFGRTCTFSYDSTNTYLLSITDVIGIVSKFAYQESNSFINLMTTPYGSTSFHKYVSNDVTAINHGLRFGFPDGTSSVYESYMTAGGSTFHWDRHAMQLYGHEPGSIFTTSHAHKTEFCIDGTTKMMNSVVYNRKPALESVITNSYTGQTQPQYISTINKPNTVSRAWGGSTQTSTFLYNSLGHMTQSIDPVGRKFEYAYAGNGIDLTEIKMTRSGATDFVGQWQDYNSHHEPELYIDGSGRHWEFAYNGFGQLTTSTDPDSNVTTRVFDGDGYLTQIDGPMSGDDDVTNFGYDSYGRLRTIEDSEGHVLTFDYDLANRLIKTTYPDGTTEEITYKNLDPVFFKDRIGRVTQRSYDSLRQLAFVVDPLGRKTSFEWCSCGALKKLTDGAGNITRWEHDLQGRVTKKIFADNTEINYTYASTAHPSLLASKTDALSQTTNYVYNLDETLNQISYSNAVHSTSTVNLTWDPDYKRIATVQNGWGTITYDYVNYITTSSGTTLGAGMVASITNNVIDDSDITFDYDELGRVTNRSIDGATNEIDWVYDEMSRVVSETNALGQFDFTYPDNGSGTSKGITRLASIDYPNGQVTNFTYFGNTGDHRLQTIENLDDASALISEFGYQYNAAGEITQWTQQRGTGPVKNWNIGYDLAGQLSSVQTVSGQPTPQYINEHFFYNYDLAANRIAVQTNGTQTATIGGSVTASDVLTITFTDSGLSGGSKSKNYTVQGGDTTTTIATALKNAINGDTDLAGLGITATSSGAVISFASVSPNKTSVSKSLSGGATETITLAHKLSVKQAAHNNVNALTGISQGGATRFLATTNKAIKSATVASQPATLDHAKQFQANPVLTSGTNSVSVSATDGGDNVETDGFDVPIDTLSSQTLTYDSNGNMTSDGTNSFQWDAENRLIKIVFTGVNNFTEFSYDGLGRNVKIVETESGSVTSTKQFVWNGNDRSEERDGSDALSKKFFGSGQEDGSTNRFYAVNHLGSVMEITDDSADVISRYSYGPFGQASRIEGSVDADFRFAGMYVHQRSGNNLTLFRAFNPNLSVWLNRDPASKSGGRAYNYADNNPISMVDPLGLESYAGGMADSMAGGMSDSQAGTMADTQSTWPCGGSMAGGMSGSMAGSMADSQAGSYSAGSLLVGTALTRTLGGARAIPSLDPRILVASALALKALIALREIYMNADKAITFDTTVSTNSLRFQGLSYVYQIDFVGGGVYKFGISSPGDPTTNRLDRQLRMLGRGYTGQVLGWYNQRIQARIVEWSLINTYAVTHGHRPPGNLIP